jgi:hypothetical protein
VNPEELERLRRLFMPGLQVAPRDVTVTPRPAQPMTMRAADEEVGLPDVPEPSAAQRAVQVAQEFVPGFSEGMAARRMANEARYGRMGRAATEGAALAAGVLPVGDIAKALRGKKGIQAWHGSPARFSQFSDEMALTGEGAQVRGHGTYTGTSRPEIEQNYKTGRGSFLLRGEVVRPSQASGPYVKSVPGTPPLERVALTEFDKGYESIALLKTAARQLAVERAEAAGVRPANLLESKSLLRGIEESDEAYDRAIEIAESRLRNNRNKPYSPEEIDDIVSLLRNRDVRDNPGFLYDVNLQVNPQRFLNFNAPLERQPQFTQRALRQTNNPALAEAIATAPVRKNATSPTGGDVLKRLEYMLIQESVPKGKSTLQLLTSGAYRAAEAPAQRSARDILAEQGLEYTQYTPYGGKAKRGRHLIVYDPNNVKIRNILQAIGLMTGAGAIASEEEPENP